MPPVRRHARRTGAGGGRIRCRGRLHRHRHRCSAGRALRRGRARAAAGRRGSVSPPVRRRAGARRAGGPALNPARRRPTPFSRGVRSGGRPPRVAGRPKSRPAKAFSAKISRFFTDLQGVLRSRERAFFA
ncbi:hypothetical protein F01_310023 [Burkholderia cenocepacia]|nr:hypothetical protein F01_310023 [Burkholderia cenocepacia]